MHLFEIRLRGGRSHKEFATFLDNVTTLGAKAPDHGGISSACLLAHRQDAEIVHLLATRGIRQEKDIKVTEVTKVTLGSDKFGHVVYADVIDSYFRRFHELKNL